MLSVRDQYGGLYGRGYAEELITHFHQPVAILGDRQHISGSTLLVRMAASPQEASSSPRVKAAAHVDVLRNVIVENSSVGKFTGDEISPL